MGVCQGGATVVMCFTLASSRDMLRLPKCMVQAARYQIMIMFLIAATTCIAVVGTVYLAVLSIMDRQHRLCSEKILPKAAATSGVEHWIQGQTIKVCNVLHSTLMHWAGQSVTFIHVLSLQS